MQERLRGALVALEQVHRTGRLHHLELSSPAGQSWVCDVAAFLRERAPVDCPVEVINSAHPQELRGTARRPGLLAGADDGIVVLEVGGLSPEAWEACAEALLAGRSTARNKDGLPTGPARPARFSAVLVGPEPELRALRKRHPEIARLFARQIIADSDLPRDEGGVGLLAAALRSETQDLGLPKLSNTALSYLIEDAAGGRTRRRRLSNRTDLAIQAITEAAAGSRAVISKPKIVAALAAIHSRRDAAESYARARIEESLLVMDFSGSARGLVNGLMVYGGARQSYCMPGRVSARVSAGREGVINLEREAKFSGSSFDKGVFQLSAWLRGKFGHPKQVSFAATLVFEQSTSKIDGNSATLAETLSLMSALSGVAAKQGVGVSGAMSQRGEILPIGSASLKVEGWWKCCRQTGLTGNQGVLLPARNIGDLQLPEELVADIKAGRFHLWAVHHVEEAIEVVLGQRAGKRLKKGGWTRGSVYARTAQHLALLARSSGSRAPKKAKTKATVAGKDETPKGK